MAGFEGKILDSIAAKSIPGCVLTATAKSTNASYAKAFGPFDIQEPEGRVLHVDDPMEIMSCTKFMTSVAVLQCVERGILDLDEDIVKFLPEFKDREILVGFDGEEKPIMKKNTKTITLRHLLTHSSGVGYGVFNTDLMKWKNLQPKQADDLSTTILYDYPLLFEPGTSWQYGAGIDWAGIMVARANNTTLEKFMDENIWKPLGIVNATFHPSQHADYKSKLPKIAYRVGATHPTIGCTMNPDGELITMSKPIFLVEPVEDLGGAGLFISAPEYQKLLTSICNNDGKVLSPAFVDILFTPSVTPEAEAAFLKFRRETVRPEVYFGGLPGDIPATHGLGGAINIEDLEGGRKKGSMCWTGMTNTFWWIDRTSGICGTYWSQLLPHGDPKVSAHFAEFERGIYEKLSNSS